VVVADRGPGSLEVQKLQHACIDFLALVLKSALVHPADVLALARRTSQVTLTARQPALREGADLLPLLLHFVCTGWFPPSSSFTSSFRLSRDMHLACVRPVRLACAVHV
jgi:hypothetical protein